VTVPAAALRAVPLLADLPDQELEAWAAAAEERTLEPGEVLQRRGEPAEGFTLLLSGALDGLQRGPGGVDEVEHQHRAPTWLGAIPLLTDEPYGIGVRAAEPSRVALVAPDAFRRLVFAQPSVLRTIMRTFRPTFARVEAAELQREKLAALGTMAAGLAHELNNPAAAARRSAAELAEALDTLGGVIGAFVESGVERAEAERLVGLQREAMRRAADGGEALDALDAADREEAMIDLLERHGVPEAWRLAEPLAAAGLDEAWLAEVARLAGSATGAAVRWVAASLTAQGLAEELRSSTARMSDLVGAVKAYAYMDQGSLQEVDVHDGIESTLVILGHKLKRTEIRVERRYDRSLPRICVHGSELNQVWTNLLDNAIGALDGQGTITIATRPWPAGGGVEVSVADDGPGIPEELQRRVLEPFFTTKAPGEGTGLGLDTSRRIVVDRHHGDLALRSRPGETVFTVRLPARPPRGA
jgi:signal transduction histidine kinase